jgi:hypothetical protein
MLKIKSRSSAVRGPVAASVLLLALAACGGSSDAASTPSSSATGSPGANGPGGGFGGVDMTAIQACLKAAGIDLPTPSGGVGPSGQPRPTGSFNGTPPADGVPPSGAPGGGAGGGMFESAEVQAALKACGITVPTGRGPRPTATS